MADADAPVTGKIYWQCYQLQQHVQSVQEISAAKRKEVEQLVTKRWEMLHSVMHAAGYVLDPEFQTHASTSNVEVMEGFMTMVERVLPELEDQVRVSTFLFLTHNASIMP